MHELRDTLIASEPTKKLRIGFVQDNLGGADHPKRCYSITHSAALLLRRLAALASSLRLRGFIAFSIFTEETRLT